VETADTQFMTAHCDCGWTGMLLGVQALKHWIEPWRNSLEMRASSVESWGTSQPSIQEEQSMGARGGKVKSSSQSPTRFSQFGRE
jgi:hypothetical protein